MSQNLHMNRAEELLLESLDAILRPGAVRAEIEVITRRAARKLAQDRQAVMAWEPIPHGIFAGALPASIRSSWVFILRAGANTGAERHPNSHQRMMSFEGTGNLMIRQQEQWYSNVLVSETDAPLERRWISIPQNVWHQPVIPKDANWVVVSFHTVPPEELIEERPDFDTEGATKQMRYLASKGKKQIVQPTASALRTESDCDSNESPIANTMPIALWE